MVVFTVGTPAWVMLKYPEYAGTTDAHPAAPRTREYATPAARGRHHDSRTRALSPDAS
jgi:hypothetical protein